MEKQTATTKRSRLRHCRETILHPTANTMRHQTAISRSRTVHLKNVQRGVGTHAAIVGCYHSNIRIENNKFINIPGYAIIATNYINSSIKNNEITDCASGIIFRDMAITLYPSEKGNKSKTPKISSKSVIANNKIEITDKKYKNVNYGIQLLGEYRSKQKRQHSER